MSSIPMIEQTAGKGAARAAQRGLGTRRRGAPGGTMRRPGFEPWQIRLATDASGTPVGTAFVIRAGEVGYVEQLAVRSDQRGRGLARALVADAFDRARARGALRSELSTDSRTGALGLYEKVGMVVTKTYHHWQTNL